MKYLYYILRLWFTPKVSKHICGPYEVVSNTHMPVTEKDNPTPIAYIYIYEYKCTQCNLMHIQQTKVK